MKIFISWSGELSCKVAKILKRWIPCVIQSVDVFFSPEDIEKGNNWDKTISTELENCSYGIICLTKDNVEAPWINFEAGAIAKSLNSKVSALMINIKPSDIKGPICRYQATKIEKEDFFKLLKSINESSEEPLEMERLQSTFDIMWNKIESDIEEVIKQNTKNGTNKKSNDGIQDIEPLEEILRILRQNNAILSNPERLFPVDYLDYVQNRLKDERRISNIDKDALFQDLFSYIDNIFQYTRTLSSVSLRCDFLEKCKFRDLLELVYKNTRNMNDRRLFSRARIYLREYKIITTKEDDNISEEYRRIIRNERDVYE